ncbi:Heavy metal-associated domain containing protein [Quillaja saponaria]|uniref:Heavy metal-associated domain containing protein n=1 Tax=Quillaja saponaria TaxID=32244 RepID=A0AAD7KNM2_QUISA|nr:Heavy metal-associated domain containing protein [Quillaja saponaria]
MINKIKAVNFTDGTVMKIQRIGIKNSKSLHLRGTSLASVESLSMPLVQEIVLSADMQCEECQKRVADIILRMNAEPESVLVNVLEKEVTLTCRLQSVGKVTTRQIVTIYRNPFLKVALINRLFRSSRG